MKANLYVHVAVTGQPQVTFLILHSSFVFDIESLIGSVHTYAARLTNLPSEGSLASSAQSSYIYAPPDLFCLAFSHEFRGLS